MKEVDIPHSVDLSPMLFLYELEVIMIFCACFALGIVLNASMTFMLIGLAAAKYYNTRKRGFNRGFLRHSGYRVGIVKFRGPYENGHTRTFGG